MTMPQDGKRLPDDTLLDDVVLTGRARHVCRYPEPEITTIGQLREMTDFELLRRANCGKMTLLELRLLTGQWQPGKRRKSDEMQKAEWVRHVAAGECECSFEEWKNAPV
jgi:DNA-directed RNA polymerase alpha subunit